MSKQKYRLEVKVHRLRVGDLATLAKVHRGKLPPDELVAILNRCIEGGVNHLPLAALTQALDEVMNAIQDTLDYHWEYDDLDDPAKALDEAIAQLALPDAARVFALVKLLDGLIDMRRVKRRR